jgi:hypothetical protein
MTLCKPGFIVDQYGTFDVKSPTQSFNNIRGEAYGTHGGPNLRPRVNQVLLRIHVSEELKLLSNFQ